MECWITVQDNPRLKVGDAKEKDSNTIEVDILTEEGNVLVQRLSWIGTPVSPERELSHVGLRTRLGHDGRLEWRLAGATVYDAHWLIILALAVAAIVWVVRSTTYGTTHQPYLGRPRGLDVLEERYARGEINRDEYLQKKGDSRDVE